MTITKIINLKELKKLLTEGFGKPCKKNSGYCPTCIAWWHYKLIEEFVKYIENLEE